MRAAPLLAPLLAALAACAAPAPVPDLEPDPAPVPLRVVAYNIKHGRGLDGVVDLERTAAVLAPLDADVVLLQEVDERCVRSGGVDQAAELAGRLGMTPEFLSFMPYDGGRYGLATLSRLPVLGRETVALPRGEREPRAALIVTVDVEGRAVRIANAHLDWLGDDTARVGQAELLRAALLDDAGPVVLGGDLNDRPDSRTLEVFTAGAPALAWLGPEGPTFPADAPDRTIDHFLVAPPEAFGPAVVEVVPEEVASDHRPVLAALTLR